MKHLSLLLTFLLVLLGQAAPAAAQDYPSRPITLVVPSAPSGAGDALARALAEEMGQRMKQVIVVDNKPGASGLIAAQIVARSAPDGYTLLFTHQAPVLNAQFMFSKLPYDVKRDLAFITQVCSANLVLAVHRDVPVNSMRELVTWARNNPGRANYGSMGIGTASHLLAAYLNSSQHLSMTHVGYKGETPMVQDLLGGQVAFAIGSLGVMSPHFSGGTLRPLAVISAKRLPEFPHVPTLTEAGFSDPALRQSGWLGLMGRAGTPAAILARVEAEARTAIRSERGLLVFSAISDGTKS